VTARPGPRPRRGAGLLVALAVVGLGAAACTTHHSAATGSTSTSESSTTTSTTNGMAHCISSDLTGSVAGTQGAAGTQEVTYELRNASAAPCALLGYPGAQLNDSSGAALPTEVVRGGSYSFTNFAPTAITIAPGASAYFNMGYSDVPSGSGACPTAQSLWITPPDDVDHLVVSEQLQVCGGGKLTVSPVFAAGSTASQTTAPPHT